MAGLNRSGEASFTCAQYKYAREPVTATAVEVPPSSAPPTRPIRSRSLCHSVTLLLLTPCPSVDHSLLTWCRLHCATSRHLCATARGQRGTDAPSVESREAAADTLPCLRLQLPSPTPGPAFPQPSLQSPPQPTHHYLDRLRRRKKVARFVKVYHCSTMGETKTFLLCKSAAAVAAGKVSFVAMRRMLLGGWPAHPG